MLFKAVEYSREMHILQFMVDAIDENGTTFVQSLLGARGIDTVDPENIEAVLSTNFTGMTYHLHSLGLHRSLKMVQTTAWASGLLPSTPCSAVVSSPKTATHGKSSRQLLRPHFTSNRDQNFNQIKDCVQEPIESIPDGGRIVDLQPKFFKLTFDTTMFLLFGDAAATMD